MDNHDNKKQLTSEVIKKDLHLQKGSIWAYVLHIGFLIFIFVMSIIGHPIGLVLAAMFFCWLMKMILHDYKISKFKYNIIECVCIGMRYIPDGEGADAWELDFKDTNNIQTKSMLVKKDLYNTTKTGDEFYVVFLAKEKSPCLCYRKSEWLI